MTWRAFIAGLMGAVLIGAGGRFCSHHVPGMHGIVTGHLPVTVFGFLIFFIVAINPLLGRIRSTWRMKPAEIALALAMILAGCSIPTAGLMRYFPRTLIHPIVNNRTEPGWQKAHLLEMTPPALLANGGKYSEEVVDNYLTPMGEPGHPIPITAVPWYAWWRPLAVWGGIILCILMGVIGLSVLVHRQWARQERLRYPLAELATSLLRQDEHGRTILFQSRQFWYAAAIVFGIRLLNGFHVWFPNSFYLPLRFDFSALKTKFPEFMATPGASSLTSPTIYPVCVGITFLLASDIGFSLGIANLLSVLVLYGMLVAGADTSGSQMTGGIENWLSFGSFAAMALMLIYSGRRYYWQTLKGAVTFRPQQEADASGVWAFRTFIVCMTGATAILAAVGLDWPVALMAVGLTMLIYLVCARLVAECGTFFFAPAWMMPGVVVGLFGLSTLGPKIVIILGLLFYVLTFDPFESLMPFAINGLKIASDSGLQVGRVGILLAIGIVLAIAVAVPTALWSDYNLTPDLRHGGDSKEIYVAAQQAATELDFSGRSAEVSHFSAWQRLRNAHPDSKFLVAAGVGFALLIGCSVMRLRHTWWPLHPVAILGFGSWTMGMFGFSFFLGWLLKAAVTRFGGAASFMKLKPVVIGAIIGDLAGGFILIIAGWLYYAIVGTAGTSAMLW